MNILYYSLPSFLKWGESSYYCTSHLNALTKLQNFNNLSQTLVMEDFLKDVPLTLDGEIIKRPLSFTTEDKSTLTNYINQNSFDIFHCFHNGFTQSCEIESKRISTIYTTLPFLKRTLEDEDYKTLYLKRMETTMNLSNSLVVPFNHMRDELSNYFNYPKDQIEVIPPYINFNLLGKSKVLSKTYIKSKFNITEDYFLYIGELNNRNTLIETIKLFSHHIKLEEKKLVLSIFYLEKNIPLLHKLMRYIDDMLLSSSVIFLNSLSESDKINLINGAYAFINLNPYNELNITSLHSMLLNTKVITYQTQSNLEYLESYPTYISEGSYDFNEFIDVSQDEIYDISLKFNINNILLSYNNLYYKEDMKNEMENM